MNKSPLRPVSFPAIPIATTPTLPRRLAVFHALCTLPPKHFRAIAETIFAIHIAEARRHERRRRRRGTSGSGS
jgi:hypothetical protein